MTAEFKRKALCDCKEYCCVCFFQISSLQSQIHSQESDLLNQEEELSRAKADLTRLQQEESQLEQSLQAGKIQLETIIKSLKATQDEINQVMAVELFTPLHHESYRSQSGI